MIARSIIGDAPAEIQGALQEAMADDFRRTANGDHGHHNFTCCRVGLKEKQ